MPVRIAINGFGRVGRCTLRAALLTGADIEVVAINDSRKRDSWRTCSSTTPSTGVSRAR